MAVVVENLTYTYPRAARPALDNLTLHIPEGQFCAIVGANGAGKTTLCHALTGFIPHFYRGTLAGDVQVVGKAIAQTPLADLAGEIGLVFANPFNQITGARFTVREEIAFGLENLGLPRDEMVARIAEVLALTGLEALADRSPYALSGGQQQRLAIASVIAMRPRLLVLDEPTSQLDPVGAREVFTVLRDLAAEGSATVVLAEHKLEWVAAFTDRVLALAGGRLVADGPPREVLAAPEIAQAGIGQTRYTIAARHASERRLAPAGKPLPVTLDQAVEFFQ
ncbi:MAG: energy-coupling factor ABC transporter ATP-binding protein [Chloroflexi bacterium]|nr:energy-coupling factor ABC transporter ATP-binding protein [Chloroflexota bacterium]MCI0575566.1 energy-coupling factor ABC transporter ATP-binding protein [Chloroflexota bacterium]MCI0649775.1 energy-coupling factor ABC transporter ATP-binding protein [Chloroflexota bacterium]MCI0726928.1 energy-coupling factor ABC transporter ATP-binding protein [Chloroflexota bacterium]